jgi:Circularly permutated YpsA SLOG family
LSRLSEIDGSAIMLKKILTGGESGAEQAAWRAGKAFGIAVGGWMPEGFPTADGPRPEFAEQYGSREFPTDNRTASTEQNIHDSDATLWFGETTSEDAQTAVAACHRLGKPCMLIYPTATFAPSHVAAWVRRERIETLTVAGNREAVEPGIGDRVERFLGQVLQQLGYDQPRSHRDASGPA